MNIEFLGLIYFYDNVSESFDLNARRVVHGDIVIHF